MGKKEDFGLISSYGPVKWSKSNEDEELFSITRSPGIQTRYILHKLNDQINDSRKPLEKVLIEYQINGRSHNLFKMKDFLNCDYFCYEQCEGNIRGELAERIAQNMTRTFLLNLNGHGKLGEIFGNNFPNHKKNDLVVSNNNDYVLKTTNYPNMILLKSSGKGKFGYEPIKEIDGLFDYRWYRQNHIIVLESKLEKLSIKEDDLVDRLFNPLKELFPGALFSYIVCASRNSIFLQKDSKQRILKKGPVGFYKALAEIGVNTLFFPFNETPDDFHQMKRHILNTYKKENNLKVVYRNSTVILEKDAKELSIFVNGQTPLLKLTREQSSGKWDEVILTHKKKKKKKNPRK